MILEKKIYFKAISKSIMGAQKGKKNILAKLIYQSSQLSWFLKTKWKTITKSKKGDFMELFLPKNDFKTCSAVNFLKKHADFGALETNQRHEL